MQRSGRSKPVRWTERAKQDLERIFDHIAEHFTPELASQKIEALLDEVGTLAEFPRKGAISKNFQEIRELVVEGNTIYYRNNEDDVVITTLRPRRTDKKY